MASEDVIELGSSDDEPEPAPKKMKPTPDAMVHIPSLRGVSINATKSSLLSVKKSKQALNSPLNKKAFATNTNKPSSNLPTNIGSKLLNQQSNKAINPLNAIMKLNNPNLRINKIISKDKIKEQTQNTLRKLPSGLIIKKAGSGYLGLPGISGIKGQNNAKQIIMPKQQSPLSVSKINVKKAVKLDITADSMVSKQTSPQWYLKPEEDFSPSTLETENNKEPDISNMIEITIEDSPIKPIQVIDNKSTSEIGKELSITIDDSPLKQLPMKKNCNDSDSENSPDSSSFASKKKLEYPENEDTISTETVEIEVEPMNSDEILENGSDHTEKEAESNVISSVTQEAEQNEFHPVYQNFIDLCFKIENSEDMIKIVEKKIKAYYRQVPKEYTESEEFIDLVSSKITAIRSGPEKMYLYIKDVVDELNLQRKLAKTQVIQEVTTAKEPNNPFVGEDSEFNPKRQRQIKKLEKTIKKLHRAIQKLEEQEVDFDDDEDSVYLLTERYKERMVRVHKKFCQLTNTKMPSEPRIVIESRPGQPTGPAKRLEKWVNKKVPIGTPLPFPDFHDVLRCVRQANDEDKLGWNEADIMEEARDLFTRCGRKLQRRRQENEWRLASSRISTDLDPAEGNDELLKELAQNKKLASTKEREVLNKFADKQKQLKLEAEEIGDKEADESPLESEEEEVIDESTSLEDKSKRKEMLRRLIHGKSKNKLERKENDLINDIEKALPESEVSIDKEVITEEKTESTVQQEISTSSDKTEQADEINQSENKLSSDKSNLIDDKVNDNLPNKDNVQDETQEDPINKEVDSDIDELHLLQKLHSENEVSSSESSDESEVNISTVSDTLGSSSENESRQKQPVDIISIENSSFSEAEESRDVDTFSINLIDNEDENSNDVHSKHVDNNVIECDDVAEKERNKEGSVDSNEDVLLNSDDDYEKEISNNTDESINLKDDALSIGDTVVEDAVSNDIEKNVADVINEDLLENKNEEATGSNLFDKECSNKNFSNNLNDNYEQTNIDMLSEPIAIECSESKSNDSNSVELVENEVINCDSENIDNDVTENKNEVNDEGLVEYMDTSNVDYNVGEKTDEASNMDTENGLNAAEVMLSDSLAPANKESCIDQDMTCSLNICLENKSDVKESNQSVELVSNDVL